MAIGVSGGEDSRSTASKYLTLMSDALQKKLFVRMEKHLDSNNMEVLSIKIFPIDREPPCLFSKHAHSDSSELYYAVLHFIKDYNLTKEEKDGKENETTKET